MIREPIAGPRAWTRRTIRESDWRIAVPSSCLAEIEQLARVLERDPAPTFLLDPSDYELDACRNLLGEVRRRLDEGPGVAVVDRIPIEELSGRPQIEAVFWLLAAMVGRPVVQTLDGRILLEVTDTGVKKRIGVRGFRTNVAQPPHVDNSFNHAPPDHVMLASSRIRRILKFRRPQDVVVPPASSDEQRARVLTGVKALRFAPPPLRGASGPDAGSAHARPDWLLLTMPAHTTPTCCGRPSAQNPSFPSAR